MIGRMGTALGAAGINIEAAAVGYDHDGSGGTAVMVVMTDEPVPADIAESIAGEDGFTAGRAVTLT